MRVTRREACAIPPNTATLTQKEDGDSSFVRVPWALTLLARKLARPPSREDWVAVSLETSSTSWIEARGRTEEPQAHKHARPCGSRLKGGPMDRRHSRGTGEGCTLAA